MAQRVADSRICVRYICDTIMLPMQRMAIVSNGRKHFHVRLCNYGMSIAVKRQNKLVNMMEKIYSCNLTIETYTHTHTSYDDVNKRRQFVPTQFIQQCFASDEWSKNGDRLTETGIKHERQIDDTTDTNHMPNVWQAQWARARDVSECVCVHFDAFCNMCAMDIEHPFPLCHQTI